MYYNPNPGPTPANRTKKAIDKITFGMLCVTVVLAAVVAVVALWNIHWMVLHR